MVALSKNFKSKLSKTYKKYINGGDIDEEGNQKITRSQIAQGSVAVAGLAAPLVAQQDEITGGVLGGASSGASAGAIFGPIGMGVGAGVGAVVGGIQAKNNKDARLKAEQEYKDAVNKQNTQLAIQRGLQTPVMVIKFIH